MSSTTSNAEPTVPATARPPLLRWGMRVAVGGIVVTALMGVLHMPFAAPVLRAVFPGSVCPIQRGTPEQIDRAHDIGAKAVRASATGPAPARPALGFELDKSTKADLDAWAAKHQVTCKAIAGNETLQKCKDVPPEAVGQDASFGKLEEITFEFRATGELTTVQTMRRGLSPSDAARIAGTLERKAASVLGPPNQSGGEAEAAYLGASFMRTFVAEHTFTDYRTSVAATNLAHTGVMVREDYMSAR